MATRGRTPLLSDETILEAALAAFANLGYDGTSVRALNAELGVSHETITQRFGTKPELFRAAVRFGMQRFVDDFDASMAASETSNDLERLRASVKAFMVATSQHPNLGALLHQGAISSDDRSELAAAAGLDLRVAAIADLLRRLHEDSRIHHTSMRELWFVMEAGAAPLHFPGVASMFDALDGPFDTSVHLERMVDMVMRSLVGGLPAAPTSR